MGPTDPSELSTMILLVLAYNVQRADIFYNIVVFHTMALLTQHSEFVRGMILLLL